MHEVCLSLMEMVSKWKEENNDATDNDRGVRSPPRFGFLSTSRASFDFMRRLTGKPRKSVGNLESKTGAH